jgi:CysZ protein
MALPIPRTSNVASVIEKPFGFEEGRALPQSCGRDIGPLRQSGVNHKGRVVTNAFSRALDQLFAPTFRAVLFKSVGLVLAIFVVLGAGLQALVAAMPPFESIWLGWVDEAAAVVAGLGILVSMWFLIVPVTALVAGLFLDEIAEAVERRYYPADPPGREQPFVRNLGYSVRFALVVLAFNIVALPFYLIPGVGLVIHFVLNGYLLGREYFELVALRHMPWRDARSMRRYHRLQVIVAGAVLAGLLLIPVVNFLVPLFGTAFMVHIFKGLEQDRPLARGHAV